MNSRERINGRLLLVPSRQFQILGVLHPSWPFQSQIIADRTEISRHDIYNHMNRIKALGWVIMEMVDSPYHAKSVPSYRISDLGRAALEYGRLERET